MVRSHHVSRLLQLVKHRVGEDARWRELGAGEVEIEVIARSFTLGPQDAGMTTFDQTVVLEWER